MIISSLLAAEGLAQLGCALGAVSQQSVLVWVLVRLVVALWTLLHVSPRLLEKYKLT